MGGVHGLIIAGPNCRRHESTILTFVSLRCRDLFLRNFHIRMNTVSRRMQVVQHKVNTATAHPNRVLEINHEMAQVALDVSIMELALIYMHESLSLITVPPEPTDDPAAQKLADMLDF